MPYPLPQRQAGSMLSGVLARGTLALWAALAASLVATPAAPPDSSAIERLLQQLGSPKFAEREAATEALKAIGEPAVEALRKVAAQSSDAEVRRRAQQLVKEIEDRVCVEVRRFQGHT